MGDALILFGIPISSHNPPAGGPEAACAAVEVLDEGGDRDQRCDWYAGLLAEAVRR
jgi:hypothetical protein